MALVLKPYKSVCPRFCQEPYLNRAGPMGHRRMGLVDLLWGEVPVRLGMIWRECPLPQNHTTQSVLDSAQTLAGQSH